MSVDLSAEMLNASQRFASHNSLTLNPAVQTYSQEYWSAMSNGSGVNYETTYNGLGVGHPSLIPAANSSESVTRFWMTKRKITSAEVMRFTPKRRTY